MKPVIVVGGGISGVAAAHAVADRGIPVTLIDRGKRLGGRMAVQTLRGTGTAADGHPVDVGAQYLTASTEAFNEAVTRWTAAGILREWTNTFAVLEPHGRRSTTGPMRHSAPAGIRSVVEFEADRLAQKGVSIVGRPVSLVEASPSAAPTVDGEEASTVILAMPAPQASAILRPEDPTLAQLVPAGPGWEPIMALVAVFEERQWDGFHGAFVNGDPVLSWIADDGDRRGDGAAVLVAHSTPEFAPAHLADPDGAGPAMLDALLRLLDLPKPAWHAVKRWSLARPLPLAAEPDSPFHVEPAHRIAFAGDAFSARPRVEAAWLSGAAAGSVVADLLTG